MFTVETRTEGTGLEVNDNLQRETKEVVKHERKSQGYLTLCTSFKITGEGAGY